MTNDTATRAAQAMWADDHASQWFGFHIADVREGCATLKLTVKQHHCNGHGMLHGGVTFALADSAFAFACNSRNMRTVAQSNTINYLAPGKLGDTLTATAQEVVLKGKTGVYDVTVVTQAGTVIATFRGLSRAIGGTLFDPQGDTP